MPRTRSHMEQDAARAGLGRSVSNESVDAAGTPYAGDTLHAGNAPCAAAGMPASAGVGATSSPIMMTDQQLQFILQQVMHAQSVSVPPSPAPTTASSGNFTKCTARFDGTKQSDVLAFLDAVETYKDCVCVDEANAVRGLSMLLTGIAATWWKGVKQAVSSWNEAVELLKQTFGPRLPPHRVYRELFKQEQREESTDVFVCKARALLAQLPSDAVSEVVQLDMVYGLLHRRIREKVARSSFNNFMDLLREARRIEDLYDEGRRVAPAVKESAQEGTSKGTSSSTPLSSTTSSSPTLPKRLREKCGYCKFYGHSANTCARLKKKEETRTVEEAASKTSEPTITCFGCGTPGVIRSNCAVCKEGRAASTATTSSSAFQSVAVNDVCRLNPRVRPIFDVEVYGALGTALLDTGAKHSVASGSLTKHLRSNGQVFQSVETELKFADGTRRVETVETALVNVRVQGVEIVTLFMVLPGATESLLGMNFIQDAGLTLDFSKNRFTLRAAGVKCEYDLRYEREDRAIVSSAIGLRECEGALLSPADKQQLATLLKANEDIFEPGGDPTPFAVHRIDTGDAAPISTPPYRVTPIKKEMIRVEIDKMLEEDIIEEAESEWTSPVVLVPKKNGETRFCVDYRKLNAVTRTDKYPLPLIDEIISSTKPNCVMSTIDLKSGYWQVEVAPEDRHKTAFVTPFGTFQFRRMPFGLKNSPATFQRLMDRFRAGLSNVTIVAYLDDILVISEDLNSHLSDLSRVFERLRQFKLKANRNKCVFARESVVYLGHVITTHGIEPDPMKVQAVLEMAPPTKLKELRTFLQTCSWFRKFILGFSEVARALTDLTKKDRPWKWGEREAQSFEELKRRLATTPILRQPDFSQPFVLRTDASAYALGAVLLQGTETKTEQPIEYASRLLTSAERNYSTTEREALAVVWALDKFLIKSQLLFKTL
ncbi:uncharacterized protein [Maniola hyperantus]|uniref:uncharacterized protein n=1 Tax=Aphantopus hyperantus TaxID=2795564 RepID=UPI003749405F